ncbi:phage tail tape measure protein [Desulfovibrio sp. UCD-KL4C]|uniref:phage tail tape measure protein n=1 Tax=Desulfovibrio sp. UCD-KL4C TaxID=2578120 RepID=UPI0025BB5599|nr:phage tail tape measure protein [Desulfovibrio sp. UCD-KL4C]
MDVFDVFASFSLLDFISGPLGKIRSGMGETEAAGGRLSSSMGSLTKSMMPFVLAAGLFLAALAPVIGVAADFESAISGVGAVSGATVSEMKTLEQASLDLGASTAWSASEVASAEKSLAMAGFSVANNVAALPGVLDLASAAQFDLGETANVASNILSSFGMEAKQMGKVADILTTTFTSSNTTLASLSSTMANAGPVAAAAGASLAEVAAMAGKLGDVGIDASVAGTGIKIMFQRLQAPSSEAAKALSKFGIATKDASGNMLPIFDILGNLEGAMKNMGSADKAAYLQKIFGAEAVGPIQALMAQGIGTIKDYAASLDQPGKAAEVAAKQLENFNGATTILGSGFEALQITIGKIFLPILTYLVKGVTVVVGWLTTLAGNPIGKFFIAFAAAIATVVIVVGVFSAAMWAATVAAGALNLAILANPIVLVGAALVAAAVLIMTYWGDVKQFFIDLWKPVQSFVDKVEAAYHLFMGIWQMDGIRDAFSNLWGSFSSGFKDAIGGVTSLIIAMTAIFLGPIALVGAAIAGLISGVVIYWDDIQNGISYLWKPVQSFIDFLSNIDLSECGRKLWSTFTDGLKSMISAPVEMVKSGLQSIRNMLPFSDAKEGPLSTLTLSGQRMMETLAGGVDSGAGSLVDAVSGALSMPGETFKSGLKDLFEAPAKYLDKGLDFAGELLFGPPPEPALAGGDPAQEVSLNTSKPTDKTSNPERSASKSGGITINNLTLNLPNVSDAEGFTRELQKLVERYDG